jgi:hypothetical protein
LINTLSTAACYRIAGSTFVLWTCDALILKRVGISPMILDPSTYDLHIISGSFTLRTSWLRCCCHCNFNLQTANWTRTFCLFWFWLRSQAFALLHPFNHETKVFAFIAVAKFAPSYEWPCHAHPNFSIFLEPELRGYSIPFPGLLIPCPEFESGL